MTEQPALVIAVVTQGFRVRIQPRSAVCSSCAGGCGLKWLPTLQKTHRSGIYIGKTRITTLQQQTLADIQAGDTVLLGFREKQLLLGSLVVYMMPLFVFFLAMYLAKITFDNEPAIIFAGFTGLVAGLLGLKWLDRSRYCHRLPVTLRRCNGDDDISLLNPH
jgi:positive regulator of sigma E activity